MFVFGKEVIDREEEDEEEMNFENFYRWSLNVLMVVEYFEVWNYLSVCSEWIVRDWEKIIIIK